MAAHSHPCSRGSNILFRPLQAPAHKWCTDILCGPNTHKHPHINWQRSQGVWKPVHQVLKTWDSRWVHMKEDVQMFAIIVAATNLYAQSVLVLKPGIPLLVKRPGCGFSYSLWDGILTCTSPSLPPNTSNLPDSSSQVLSPDAWTTTPGLGLLIFNLLS